MKHKNLLLHIKMGRETLTFGDIETEKTKFYHNKTPIFKNNVYIEKVLVPKKSSLGEKKLGIRYWLLL